MNRILILGASGFIGNTLYKELQPYFDVYGTFNSPNEEMLNNQVMFQFNVETDDISILLNNIQPNFIISSLRGDFNSQYQVHQNLLNYVSETRDCKILFLSSVNVFDGKNKYPSYEDDHLLAKSTYGKYKTSVERLLNGLPLNKYAILRLPMVFGVNSPRIYQLKQVSKQRASLEVFPNLIISITTANKIAQQIHYLINKDLNGIFHLASKDMIHHDELFNELVDRLEISGIVFKHVYHSNNDSYLAILPKKNKLPKTYRTTVAEVINEITLKEEIETIKGK